MARSQLATSWQPAAVATPCTLAITGCGIDCTVVISDAQVSNSSAASSPSQATSSVRSWPAEKAGPGPGDHHHPPGGLLERGLQLAHEVERQGVAPVGSVEGDLR